MINECDKRTDFASLLDTDEVHRDSHWEKAFLDQFATQKVAVGPVGLGPDQWPYLFVESGKKAKEPVWQIIDWLSHRGMGLVVNGEDSFPDYVFTYGMIWNFKQTGAFVSPCHGLQSSSFVLEPGQRIFFGPPSIQYIPLYVRTVLKQFFTDQGLVDRPPLWLMVSGDGKHYDLCFSIESLGNPPKKEHQWIAEFLSWFFPNHFSIVLTSEKFFPKFYNL